MIWKAIKTYCVECYENPKEGFEITKMIIGAFITAIFGGAFWFLWDGGKKVLDRISTK